MNGAMAEPLVSTIRPPKITIMIRIGRSQNFLRSLMKAQSSTRMAPIDWSLSRSELVFHRLGRRPRRMAVDPVALGRMIDLEPQEILAEDAHDEADRRDGDEEQQPQDERVHHLVKQQPELQPKLVERAQKPGDSVGNHQEGHGDRQGPVPAGVLAPPGEDAHKREEAGKDQAEAPVAAGFDMLFARKVLVKLAG